MVQENVTNYNNTKIVQNDYKYTKNNKKIIIRTIKLGHYNKYTAIVQNYKNKLKIKQYTTECNKIPKNNKKYKIQNSLNHFKNK